MKLIASLFLIAIVLSVPARAESEHQLTAERLGTVVFSLNSLLRSRYKRLSIVAWLCFTTSGTKRLASQFEEIAKADPPCAMAHWGIAMSVFHQQSWMRQPQP